MKMKMAGSLLLVAFAVSLAVPVIAAVSLDAANGCETPAPNPRPEPEIPQAP